MVSEAQEVDGAQRAVLSAIALPWPASSRLRRAAVHTSELSSADHLATVPIMFGQWGDGDA